MRIAVAMSGGVDSSVAALLLHRQGAEVVGLSMHLWNHDRDGTGASEGRCCTLDDLNVARRAAEMIDIPHFVLDLEKSFTDAVVKPFVTSYLEGRTPIPCTVCNTEVKFKGLLGKAEALGCEAVATGHYARIGADASTGAPRLLRAADRSRDQSYFLYDLTEAQLSRARFPLGEMQKSEVREIARLAGLPNWDKPDSQEVCFVPNGSTPADFIRREAVGLGIPLPSAPGGEIADRDGNVLGTHAGVFGFTVGQRRGLGLESKEALYVLGVHPDQARVVVGSAADLESRDVPLESVHFAGAEESGAETGSSVKVLARIRSRHPEQPALLTFGSGRSGRLAFDEPVRAAAPGQSAVFFDPLLPDVVLGGGVISRPAA